MSDERERQRAGFRAALAADEDNWDLRRIYIDWLEEQGEEAEMDRQYEWPAAKRRLLALLAEGSDTEWPDEEQPSYAMLLELGAEIAEEIAQGRLDSDGHATASCGHFERLQDVLNRSREDFLRDWSIVTGRPLPKVPAEKVWFRCGC